MMMMITLVSDGTIHMVNSNAIVEIRGIPGMQNASGPDDIVARMKTSDGQTHNLKRSVLDFIVMHVRCLNIVNGKDLGSLPTSTLEANEGACERLMLEAGRRLETIREELKCRQTP